MKTSRSATTPKEWALAIGGGLALSAALLWVLRGGDEPLSAVPAPAPVIASPPPPPAAAVPAATATAPTDLALAGLRAGPDGGMAIVIAGGRQYLLRPGRSLPGGMRLVRVEPGRAILSGPGGEIALSFADAKPGSQSTTLPGGDPTAWRLSLSPVPGPGGARGWRVENVTALPALARAGLQPGDVLIAANGADLISEEKIMELPQELATNGRLRLAFLRGSQRREAIVTP